MYASVRFLFYVVGSPHPAFSCLFVVEPGYTDLHILTITAAFWSRGSEKNVISFNSADARPQLALCNMPLCYKSSSRAKAGSHTLGVPRLSPILRTWGGSFMNMDLMTHTNLGGSAGLPL